MDGVVDGAAYWATAVRRQVRDCCRLLGSATRLRVDGTDGVALCIPPNKFFLYGLSRGAVRGPGGTSPQLMHSGGSSVLFTELSLPVYLEEVSAHAGFCMSVSCSKC